MPASRTVLIGDLHLAARPGGQGTSAAAFVQSLEPASRLVLLGDTFEIARAEDELDAAAAPAARLRRLDAVLRARPEFIAALQAHVRRGGRLVFVAGNHDLCLADARVAARLRDALGPAGAVTIHPWFFLDPGVLYAEHGSQYHDLNAVRRPRHPFDGRGRLALPPIAYLEATGRLRRAGADARVESAVAAVRLCVAGTRELAGRPLRTPEPPEGASPQPGSVEAALAGLAPLALVPMARRLSRVLAGDRQATPGAPAAAIAAIVAASGPVPVLVFAHTHRPSIERVEAPAGVTAVLNTGAWSVPDGDRHPYAAVDIDEGGAATASLCAYDARAERRLVVGRLALERASRRAPEPAADGA